jgi:hypothetical protein
LKAPSSDCDRNFLNYEERRIVSQALEKFAHRHNMYLMPLFQVKLKDLGSVSDLGTGDKMLEDGVPK